MTEEVIGRVGGLLSADRVLVVGVLGAASTGGFVSCIGGRSGGVVGGLDLGLHGMGGGVMLGWGWVGLGLFIDGSPLEGSSQLGEFNVLGSKV